MRRSNLADELLTGLKGVEVGGGAHNSFDLDTINVDYTDDMTTVSKLAEIKNCGRAMPVDVVSRGDELPFKDEEWDFVINSHVLEHFYDPVKAIKEWLRVVKVGGYVFMIIPHKERTYEKDRPLTTIEECLKIYRSGEEPEVDLHRHYTVWNTERFLELLSAIGLTPFKVLDVDDKVGNGFCVVLKKGL